jgi:hypothetical protein
VLHSFAKAPVKELLLRDLSMDAAREKMITARKALRGNKFKEQSRPDNTAPFLGQRGRIFGARGQ